MAIYKKTYQTAKGPKTSWILEFKDQAGRRRSKSFARRKDAEAYRVESRHEIARGTFTHDRDSITVADAADRWLAACQRGRNGRDPVEPHTLRQYESHVRRHIVPRLGCERLNRITAPMAREFRDQLLDDLSRPMAQKVLKSFKAILSEAQASGFVAQNVAIGLSVTVGGRNRETVEIPSRAEVRVLLRAADQNATQTNLQRAKAWRRYRALMMTAVLTGMRASELRGLAWPAVDLAGSTIEVTQRANEAGILGAPKSAAGHRRIHIPGDLVAALREWKLECPPGAKGLVFPNWQGNVEGLPNIHRRCWQPLQVAAGIVDGDGRARYTFHAVRHFRASVLIASGASPKEVQVELGHASIQVTFDLYGHLFPDDASQRQARADALAADLLDG